MKHYTCDKCGMPMENANEMEIQQRVYDICSECRTKILEGLQNKGSNAAFICAECQREKWLRY